MKRIHVNDIVIGQVYYAVCCGDISEIVFKSINPPEALVNHLALDYEMFDYDIIEFLSDIGIEYPNESYINDLNRVFETRKEATEFISSTDYQKALNEHQEF